MDPILSTSEVDRVTAAVFPHGVFDVSSERQGAVARVPDEGLDQITDRDAVPSRQPSGRGAGQQSCPTERTISSDASGCAVNAKQPAQSF